MKRMTYLFGLVALTALGSVTLVTGSAPSEVTAGVPMVVTTAAMGRARRYVLFGTVIAAAMLTPPDVISQILLAGPMYLLFELGILVARTVERKPVDASTD